MGRLTVLLLGIGGLSAATAEAADWPQWLGPTRNGVTTEVVSPWTEAPKVAWKQAVTRAYSSPIVVDGAVVIHSAADGSEAEQVLVLDAMTGQERWTDSYPRERYRSMFGAGPRTTPTAVDGKLFTFGITGVLSGYDLQSGKRLWQTNPYEVFKGSLPRFGVCSSPLVVDGRVIVMVGAGGSAVVAYDAATGEVAWKALDEPASSASPIVMTRGEGDEAVQELVVQTTLRVVGLSPKDGTVKWEHPLVFQPAGVSPTPLAIGKSLVVTTQDTGTMSLEFGMDKSTPNPKPAWWKQDASSYFSTGTVGPQESVLVVTNLLAPLPRTDVTCFDLAKGEPLWKQEKLGYYHAGLIATGDGKLLLLDDGGNLVLAEVSREGFKSLAKSQVCRGTLTNPALANGRVYVRDDKELICLELSADGAATSK
jgi:outer membrane protein assembly factor BamB